MVDADYQLHLGGGDGRNNSAINNRTIYTRKCNSENRLAFVIVNVSMGKESGNRDHQRTGMQFSLIEEAPYGAHQI